ncbi:MAG: hypothetical protein U0792_24560 [Gemmataceae bacterium]
MVTQGRLRCQSPSRPASGGDDRASGAKPNREETVAWPKKEAEPGTDVTPLIHKSAAPDHTVSLLSDGFLTEQCADDRVASEKELVRVAGALAQFAPDDSRWDQIAPQLVELLVRENPIELAFWAQALEPVRLRLLPSLMKRYPEARQRMKSGKLDEQELVAENATAQIAIRRWWWCRCTRRRLTATGSANARASPGISGATSPIRTVTMPKV